jgi:hypothetical protein
MWQDFKKNPPYNWTDVVDGKTESDWEVCYFVIQYTNRPSTMNSGPFVRGPAAFKNGVFEGYEIGMLKTEPYETDWFEVLAWASDDKVKELLLDIYKL